MRPAAILPLATLALACLLPGGVAAKEPVQRDLSIELRQIREGQEQAGGGAYTVSTAPRGAEFAPQQVRVRNGEKASMAINQSMPLQWVQAITSHNAVISTNGTTASSNGAGMTQALVWMESGQSLTVTPHWTSGQPSARLDIDMQAAIVDERTSADLPATNRQRLATTVTAPLGQWVTLASSGTPAQPGRYSSTGSGGRTLVQIRVSAD